MDEDDVKLVVAQTGCSEDKARAALQAENGDLINASEFKFFIAYWRGEKKGGT